MFLLCFALFRIILFRFGFFVLSCFILFRLVSGVFVVVVVCLFVLVWFAFLYVLILISFLTPLPVHSFIIKTHTENLGSNSESYFFYVQHVLTTQNHLKKQITISLHNTQSRRVP